GNHEAQRLVGEQQWQVALDEHGRRFAALLPDDHLYRAGTNRLDLYRVGADGDLRRLTLS
ncbi:hypothetical protein ABT214_01075, partial [Micromonospora purpureochromogenes]|uniref:hypothetical protein n=1 Tax=Micromonospora purpureochromogenes TaxID=47872 RepID=UPI0033250944